jgi:4-oxalocrotonate tautomerase
MPIVNIKTMRGALSREQKKQLHKRISDVFVEVEGKGSEAIRPYVVITIDESIPSNFSIGGKQASEEFVQKVVG